MDLALTFDDMPSLMIQPPVVDSLGCLQPTQFCIAMRINDPLRKLPNSLSAVAPPSSRLPGVITSFESLNFNYSVTISVCWGPAS